MGIDRIRKTTNVVALFISISVVAIFSLFILPRIKTDVSIYQSNYETESYVLSAGDTAEFQNTIDRTTFNKIKILVGTAQIPTIGVSISDNNSGEMLFYGEFTAGDVKVDDQYGCYIEVENASYFSPSDYVISVTNLGDVNLELISTTIEADALAIIAIKDTNDGEIVLYTVAIMLILYSIVLFVFSQRHELTTQSFFLISAISLSVVYIFIYPIWSTNDFSSHYAAVNRYSNLMLGRREEQWYIPDEYYNYLHRIYSSAHSPCMRGYTYFFENFHLFGGYEGMFIEGFRDDKMACYSILNYLPSSIGLLLATVLNLAPSSGLLFARLLVTITTIWGCYRAIKITPIGKTVFAAVALLPEVLFLNNSFSYDAIVVVTTLNFIACCFAATNYQDENSKKYAREAIVWAFLIGAVKGGGYLILLPLAFMLCIDTDNKSKLQRKYRSSVMIVIFGLVSVIIFNVLMNIGMSMFQFGGEVGKMSASDAFTHPLTFIKMLFNSYTHYSGKYLTGLLGSELSWSEYVLPGFLVIIMFIPLLLVAMIENDAYRLNKKHKVIFLISICLELVFMPMMLLSYTDINSATIEGVQGRYFLPILPLVVLMFTNHKFVKISKMDSNRKIIICQAAYWLHVILSITSVMWMIRVYICRSV